MVGVFIAVAAFLSRWTERLVHRALSNQDIDPGLRSSIERFSRYIVLILGVLIALDSVGIKLGSLAALGAVLMVGIGFGLQNITSNFISGLIILLERPIKKGDLVEVGGTTGRVLDIHARSTVILTRDDIAIIVPNSEFISQQVVNQSFTGEKIRLKVHVGVAYGSDTEKVKNCLLKVAADCSSVLKDPAPSVLFKNFGDSSLDFVLRVWIDDVWHQEGILSDLRFVIDQRFKKENIEIPFPQTDLHFKSSALGLGIGVPQE